MARNPKNGEAVPFGSCLTGNHKKCKTWTETQGKIKQCPCECDDHGIEYVPAPGPSKLLLEIIEKYSKN